MSTSPPLLVVVAPVFRIAKHFCSHQHRPPVNHLSPNVVIVTKPTDAHRLAGVGAREVELHVVGNLRDLKPGVMGKVREKLEAESVTFVRPNAVVYNAVQ